MVTSIESQLQLFQLFDPGKSAMAELSVELELEQDERLEESFSLLSADHRKTEFSIDGQQLEAVNSERAIEDAYNTKLPQTLRYNYQLEKGKRRIEYKTLLPVGRRFLDPQSKKALLAIYTVFVDFTSVKRMKMSQTASGQFCVTTKQAGTFFDHLLYGPLLIRIGSKASDEERGILHKVKSVRQKDQVRASVDTGFKLSDIYSVTAALKSQL